MFLSNSTLVKVSSNSINAVSQQSSESKDFSVGLHVVVCQHEESVHLSVAHEEHLAITAAPVCCHASQTTTCNPTEKSLDSEDCCETAFTELDETLTNVEFDKNIDFGLLESVRPTQHIENVFVFYSSPLLVFDNGPPIYVKYQKLLFYA
jgi:hypothetical protein